MFHFSSVRTAVSDLNQHIQGKWEKEGIGLWQLLPKNWRRAKSRDAMFYIQHKEKYSSFSLILFTITICRPVVAKILKQE
jgi:hypothetical protein